MNKRLQETKALHLKVIHVQKAKALLPDIYKETRRIKRLNDFQLNYVCKDCFRDPS